MNKFIAKRKALKARQLNHSGSPTPASQPRLVALNDNPWLDYIGWREACSGLPHWEDGSCQCRHEEVTLAV